MTNTHKVLVLTGSLRSGSYSQTITASLPELLSAEYDYADLELPAYNPDLDLNPELLPNSVNRLREQANAADLIVFVTPEYNASIPGFLKNAIDWMSRPRETASLIGKPSLVIANSPSPFGGLWAAESLERSLTIAGSEVINKITIGKINEKISANKVSDQKTLNELQKKLSIFETQQLEPASQSLDKASLPDLTIA